MMWNHLRGSWDTRVPCISLSLDCWPALIPPAPWRKQTVKENDLPQRPVSSLTSFPPSALTHVPGNGAVTVCPQGLSSLGPKASWAKINYPDPAFFNPWDSDPDMTLSREREKKKGQISISPSSGYLWHTFKWLNVYLIQTPNPFSLVTSGSNVPGPLFQTLWVFFSPSQRHKDPPTQENGVIETEGETRDTAGVSQPSNALLDAALTACTPVSHVDIRVLTTLLDRCGCWLSISLSIKDQISWQKSRLAEDYFTLSFKWSL